MVFRLGSMLALSVLLAAGASAQIQDGGQATWSEEPETGRVKYTDYQLFGVEQPLFTHHIKYLTPVVDFWNTPGQNGTEVLFSVSPFSVPKVKSYLKSQMIEFKIKLEDIGKLIEEEERQCNSNRKRRISKRASIWQILGFDRGSRNIAFSDDNAEFFRTSTLLRSRDRMDWQQYHRFETIYSWMRSLQKNYPSIIQLKVIGLTEGFRDMVLAKVGIKTNKEKPAIFIEGGIHAREWVSPASVTYLINQLVTNPQHRDLLEIYDFYILPIANPDGYEYSHTKDRMWRKNRTKDKSVLNVLTNCRGVDLNRNFGYNWGETSFFETQTGTPLPCLETYIGTQPFSEKESQAIRNFVTGSGIKFVAYLAFHSFGSKIFYPWSSRLEKIEDWKELHTMANAMAEAIFDESGGADYYTIGTSAELQYVASGGSDDWAKSMANIKWVYLTELPGFGQGFLLPPDRIDHVARTTTAGVRSLVLAIAKTL